MPDPLDIQDYLDATGDASKRSRAVTIVLVVASIVVFAGWLNSLESQWMQERMLRLQNIEDPYVESYIGKYPEESKYHGDGAAYMRAKTLYQDRYLELYSGMEKAYIDNFLVIKVPFLGFTFDVNDLGLLGGIGFLAILACYRFFLSRENDNLKLSFDEADRLCRLEEFYKLLAMRQVFTVPLHTKINRSKFLMHAPKVICWFPLFVYCLVISNDWMTKIFAAGSKGHFAFLVIIECAAITMIAKLSWDVTSRLRRMDRVWDIYGLLYSACASAREYQAELKELALSQSLQSAHRIKVLSCLSKFASTAPPDLQDVVQAKQRVPGNMFEFMVDDARAALLRQQRAEAADA